MSGKRIEHQASGTRVLVGEAARVYAAVCARLASLAHERGYRLVVLPNIDGAGAWDRPDHRMFGVTKSDGEGGLVLVPERTDQVRRMVRAGILSPGDKVFYCERCYRHDRPQANRYREFTQFGVEWIGADADQRTRCLRDAIDILDAALPDGAVVDLGHVADRGSAYYTGETFEAHVRSLGASSQILGGGQYPEGFGWAIGVERLIAAGEEEAERIEAAAAGAEAMR